MSLEWGNVCTQGVRARAGAPRHPSLQPSPDSHAASEAAGERARAHDLHRGGRSLENRVGCRWGGGWGSSNLLSLQQAPAHHLPASLSREAAELGGGNSKDHPHSDQGARGRKLSSSPSRPQSSPYSGVWAYKCRATPTPFYLISPRCLPEPGSPHLGQAGCGAPSRLPRVAGLGAGRRGSRGGLCGAACSVTPPPADGCRLQQRWRRLGVRRGLGTVPAAPGLAPNARPPRPRPASEPSLGAPLRACLLPRAALPLPPPPLAVSRSLSLSLSIAQAPRPPPSADARAAVGPLWDLASEANAWVSAVPTPAQAGLSPPSWAKPS